MISTILKFIARHAKQGAFTAFTIRLSGSAITLIMNFFLFRIIGDEEAGLFLLAYSTVVFAAAFSGCGVELIVLRQTAAAAATEAWGDANSVFLKCLSLVTVFSSAVAIATFAFATPIAEIIFKRPEFADPLRRLSPAIAALALIMVISRCLQGWRFINTSVLILNVLPGFGFCAMLLTFPTQSSGQTSFYYSISAMCTMCGGLLFWRFIAQRGSSNISWSQIFESAWPVWIMVIVETLSKLAGQFFAGRYATPAEVGQLVLSQRIAMVSTIALVAATHDAAPVFAEDWKRNDIPAIRVALRKAILTGTLLASPMLLPMLLVPHLVLRIFSSRASEGGHLLQISAVGQMAVILLGASGFVLTMSKHENAMRNAVIASGVFAVAGGWVFTVLFGVTGAAVSSSMALLLMNLISSFSVKKYFGFHPLNVLFRNAAESTA